MSEMLYKIASGEKPEGSLAACKYFLSNVVGWKEEAGPPAEWKPTILDIMTVFEREGILDEEEARLQKARADHVCPHCQRPWENPVDPRASPRAFPRLPALVSR
jgi:hypothetical protein